MLSMLKSWQGTVEVNDNSYESIQDVLKANFQPEGNIHIKLHPLIKKAENGAGNAKKSHSSDTEHVEYIITVKKYMTEPATPQFDFMAKWNNNRPMPLRIMTGYAVKETRGMIYMKLHGDMYAETMCTCMKCGKRLTNKISQYFGIGPECGGHNYVSPFETQEELDTSSSQ